MRHIKLTLQYDGSDYSGWQVQKKEKTIQGVIEDAIYTVTNERIRVTGASRTDAGVHAFEQVAVFKTQSVLDSEVLKRALNANLPQTVRIIDTQECPADFHPRYSAKNKTYSYIISPANTFSPSPLPPPLEGGGGGRGNFHSSLSRPVCKNVPYSVFLKQYSWQIPYQLNCSLMREAAKHLVGKHDFSCFRASGCNSKSPVRTIGNCEISELTSVEFISFRFHVPIIKISIQADAFLRHMARNIVGTLVEVGRGKLSPLDVEEILESKDRRLAGPTAPAQGLFLEKIVY